MSDRLPPGQEPRADMPPFGLPWYAHRMPTAIDPLSVRVGGLVVAPVTIGGADFAALPRVKQISDFHCVTLWSRTEVHWSGARFADLFESLLRPHTLPERTVERVRFCGADGYQDDLPLADLLRHDVLLADTMDGKPIERGNGAPLRLVAPAHYGYKNVKFLTGIDLLGPRLRRPLITLHHPRARHAYEERIPYPVNQRAVGIFYKLTLRPGTRWWVRRMAARRDR